MSKSPITVNGQEFASLRAAAKHFGAHYGNAVRRFNSGWSIEQALGLEQHQIKQPLRGKSLVTSAGKFASIRDAANYFGIEEGTIYRRISLGWTPDQAVGLEPHTRKPRQTKEVACAGKTYPNSWALAQAYSKMEKLVAKRIRQGWTPEQAVEIEESPPRFRNQPFITSGKHWRKAEIVDGELHPATDVGEYKLYLMTNKLNGKQYVGITISPLWQRFNGHKAAVKKNLNTKLYNAMKLHGVDNFAIELIRSDARSFAELQQQEIDEISKRNTVEDGYNVSPGGSIGTPDRITVGGVTFPSKGAAAEYFGIDAGVFNLRIGRLKWTPEQAAEIEPRPKPYRKKITVNGVEYPSINQVAKEFGLTLKLVSARINKDGWTIEQAVGIDPPPSSVKCQGISVTAFGETFVSVAQCAERFGVNAESLRTRVAKYGDALEDAIRHLMEKPKGGAQPQPVTAFGMTFRSITALAAHFGLSVHSLRNRMRYQGQSLEEAIDCLHGKKVST